MNLKKKVGKLFTSTFVGTGPSSYEKRIYRAAVSQKLRNTDLYHVPEETFMAMCLWFLRSFSKRTRAFCHCMSSHP